MKGYLRIVPPKPVQHGGICYAGMGTMVFVVTEDGREIQLKGIRFVGIDFEVDSAVVARIEAYEIEIPEALCAQLQDCCLKLIPVDQTYRDIKTTESLEKENE